MDIRKDGRIFLLVAALSFLSGCGTGTDPGTPTVVVSIAPAAYLVERICGPAVSVLTLVQPGESPATYQPSDYQVSRVMQSSVYFRIGVPFERGKWLEAMEGASDSIRIQDLREGIGLRSFTPCDSSSECGHDHGGGDPHIGLDTENLKIMARTIAETMGQVDASHAGTYGKNLDSLLSDLDGLQADLEEILAPCRGKRIYIYHPAWGYLCDRFDMEQVAFESEGKEPSDEELTRIHARMGEDGASVIFVQPQIAGNSVKATAEALGLAVKVLDPLAYDVVENLRSAAKTIRESCP